MTDLRVTKTKRAIKEAFVSLVLEVGFQKVTVSAIASRAIINRQTFYKHYDDKYELARQLTAEILTWYDDLGQQRVQLAHQGLQLADVIDTLRPMLNELASQHGRTIQALRQVDLPGLSLQQRLQARIVAVATEVLGETPNDFEKTLIGAVFIGIFDYSIDRGQVPPSAEIVTSLNRLSRLIK